MQAKAALEYHKSGMEMGGGGRRGGGGLGCFDPSSEIQHYHDCLVQFGVILEKDKVSSVIFGPVLLLQSKK